MVPRAFGSVLPHVGGREIGFIEVIRFIKFWCVQLSVFHCLIHRSCIISPSTWHRLVGCRASLLVPVSSGRIAAQCNQEISVLQLEVEVANDVRSPGGAVNCGLGLLHQGFNG